MLSLRRRNPAAMYPWGVRLGLLIPATAAGQWIKRLRKAVNATQPEIAEAFNVSLRTLQYWEQGRQAPDFPTTVMLLVWDMKILARRRVDPSDSLFHRMVEYALKDDELAGLIDALAALKHSRTRERVQREEAKEEVVSA